MAPALEVKNLVKKYPASGGVGGDKIAVDGISFEIKKGEFFGFLGPNGAGKTSTISCITGTASVTSGEIKVFGLDVVKNYREARKKIRISPQKYTDTPFRALSGGYKRRVMLARAMVHDPDLLILDEPTAGVDVELRHDLWRILTDLNKKGKTILLTTHYLEEAQRLCDRIGIIFGGKIVSLESKDELIKDGQSIEEHYLGF